MTGAVADAGACYPDALGPRRRRGRSEATTMKDFVRQLRALFADMPVAVAVQRGPEMVYELANAVYCQFLGGRDLVGLPRREVLPDQSSLAGILERVHATGEPYSANEFPFWVNRSGSGFDEQRWFNFLCQPMREGDQVVGVMTLAVDVTDQVRARKQLEGVAAELRQAARLRDDFLSIASHELKTPLTPVVLQLQMLRRELERSPDASMNAAQLLPRLALVQRNVDRTVHLLESLLDVSRLAGARLDLHLVEVDLVQLTREVAERMREPLDASRSTLTIDAPPLLTGVWDRLRVEQIATNLLSNAIKYGLGNPIELRLRRVGSEAELRVADRGLGIAPEDQARIFERFERAVSSRQYAGFGLGLWIVQQLVDALGGKITVESGAGAGSAFVVRLPLPDE